MRKTNPRTAAALQSSPGGVSELADNILCGSSRSSWQVFEDSPRRRKPSATTGQIINDKQYRTS